MIQGLTLQEGEIVIKPEYDALGDIEVDPVIFKNGYIIVKKNGKLGRLSKNGVFTPFE